MSKETLTVIAGALFVISFVPYGTAILINNERLARTRTVRLLSKVFKVTEPARPMWSSWLIWATLDTITLAAMVTEGTLNGQIVGVVGGAWIIFALTLKYGEASWTWLDTFCLVGAIVGIAVILTGDGVLTLKISMAVVIIASVPTAVSAWKDPTNENRIAWSIMWISCVAAVFAIPGIPLEWKFADMAQPLVFFGIETVVVVILYLRPIYLRAKQLRAVS